MTPSQNIRDFLFSAQPLPHLIIFAITTTAAASFCPFTLFRAIRLQHSASGWDHLRVPSLYLRDSGLYLKWVNHRNRRLTP